MYVLILVLWVVLVGAYINGPVGDPDLWWHITVGRWIVANHRLPDTDLWNAFSDGGIWRAYSWMHEIAYSLVESAWGISGLWTMQLLLAIAMVGGFVISFSYLAKDWFLGTLLATVVAVACFQNFSLRPQTFVWILFAASLGMGERSLRTGLTRGLGFGVVLLFSLWANSHITAIIGIASLFLWVAHRGRVKLAASLAGLAFFGTLLTPYFGGEWLTFFSKTGHPLSMNSIAEFQSATIMGYGTGVLVVFSALVIAGFALVPRLFSPGRLILVLGLVCGGAAVVKFIPFAAIALGALLSVAWSELRPSRNAETGTGIIEGVERLRRALLWLPTNGAAFLLFAMATVVINNSSLIPLNTTLIPKAALDYIKEHNLSAPILNDFGRGGYVMYRMSGATGELPPGYKVPIDGRTNVNSHQIWKAYRLAVAGQHGWQELLELVKPNTILWRRESPLVQLLEASGGWKQEFASGTTAQGFVVLTKK